MHYDEFFNDKSEIYRTARPIYPDGLIKKLSSLAQQHGLAWDCATGNGQAAIGLSEYFDKVVATDVSENQIFNALKNDKISYYVEEAETPSLENNSVDLISVVQALHWFNYEKFWDTVDRVLKPGGVFIAWGYDWFQVDDAIDEAINKHILDSIESYWAPQNRILWEGYKDVGFPLARVEFEPYQLEMSWSLDQFFSYIHSWSATRRCMEKTGYDFFNKAYEEVQKIWGDKEAAKTVSMPLHILVGRK